MFDFPKNDTEKWQILKKEFMLNSKAYGAQKEEHSSPITSFVTLGAKNYSYVEENGKVVTKVRGFGLKPKVARESLNHGVMTEMLKSWVLDGEKRTVPVQVKGMRPNKRTQSVKNFTSTKVYRNDCFNKRYVAKFDGKPDSHFTTVPFGCRSYNFVDAPHVFKDKNKCCE